MVTIARSKRNLIRTTAVLLVSASFGAASIASASDTQTGSMGVSAAVTSNCHLTGGTIPFGNIDVTTGAQLDQSGTITVKCTNGTTYSLTADAGTGSGATTTTRKMSGTTDVTNLLDYSLFSDAAHTVNWGDGTASDDIPGTGNGTDQAITIYGRVLPSQQTAKMDSYADTVVVTVTYN